MSNYRISAATKDSIRSHYKNKISELTENIRQKERDIAELFISKLVERPEYLEFKVALTKFMEFVKEVDPEEVFADYNVSRLFNDLNKNTIFTVPYSYKLDKLNLEDAEITFWLKEKERLEKECNKLIWNLEMSPKASAEYKEAVQIAEQLLFKGE